MSELEYVCRQLILLVRVFVFFFKQKTAYEMRISDWSSDVCSSDLHHDTQTCDPDCLLKPPMKIFQDDARRIPKSPHQSFDPGMEVPLLGRGVFPDLDRKSVV